MKLTGPLLIAATLALAACGDETAVTPDVPATPAVDSTACGPTLPITGLCSNAVDPSLFLKVNAQAPKLAAKCVWRTQEVSLTPTDAIVFRAQDCTAEGWVPNLRTKAVQTYVKYRMDGTPERPGDVHARNSCRSLPDETAEQAAMKTLEQSAGRPAHALRDAASVGAGAGGDCVRAGARTPELANELEVNSPPRPVSRGMGAGPMA